MSSYLGNAYDDEITVAGNCFLNLCWGKLSSCFGNKCHVNDKSCISHECLINCAGYNVSMPA